MTLENEAAEPAEASPSAEPVETDSDGLPDLDALSARYGETGQETDQEASETPDEPTPQETPQAAPETAPEPVPEAPKDPAERNLAILAERQREVRAEQEALREQRQAWESERTTLSEKVAKWEAIERKLQRDDAFGALQEMGVQFDSLAQAVLDGRGVNPTSALEEQVAQRISAAEQKLQAQLDAVKAAERQRAEADFVSGATAAIRSASPLLESWGENGVRAVYQKYEAIASEARHQGVQPVFPSYEDVIRSVEQDLLNLIDPLLKTETVRARLGASQTAPPKAASPTLSNQHSATVPKLQPPVEIDWEGDRDDIIDSIVRRHT
jgi:hypothetical protein